MQATEDHFIVVFVDAFFLADSSSAIVTRLMALVHAELISLKISL